MPKKNDPTEAEFPLQEGDEVQEPGTSGEGAPGERQAAGEPGATAEPGEPGATAEAGEPREGREPGEGAEPGPPTEPGAEAGPGATAETVEELRDRWHRALADADNLRKRHARELEQERSAERARTAAALLPVIDHLELALDHAGSDPSSVIEGVRAVRDQAVGTFEKLGFARHEETGVPFDPARHEAVSTVEDDGSGPGVVSEVLRPGYGDGPGQLRPAAVTVTARRE
ncbi:nucleotide exchange factor GrpE [Streptomyces sp. WMMB 322]|uniref:nucleotide exchange factor GrpE n=1 Tax=Streptomyces sp. WMMB 322 TaxID=1286821 RepID=UPI000823BF2F|nr:nucleotide exchange factor GrpE [Streptomyces sp. WMMB 322]SCK06491.1 molecular chaperone GrpE [Streptomyces sp. WMMB 322]